MRRTTKHTRLANLFTLLVAFLLSQGCTVQPPVANSNVSTQPTPASSPSSAAVKSQLTLPVLDALLREDAFVNDLKSKLQLSDPQIQQLKQASASELTRLRQENAEQLEGNADEARERASQQLSTILGENKANDFASFANDYWTKGGENADSKTAEKPATPNSVPTDTRIVVNIPAFRMDLFHNGKLVKSYKIGIGYPEFPLPQGLRKAQTIIFNPPWTPPDSPWVAKMKDVSPGETVEPGSSLNPLGPIKIPIGLPSLIHGGKAPAKIGNFASHGCVGLTNAQVKDFAKQLADVSGAAISDRDFARFLQDKTKTKVVKLGQTIPVELRYETIVVEDGKLHIYKDVYDQNTNTEQKLRDVLTANGTRYEDLSEGERSEIAGALNTMSAHPKKVAEPSPSTTPGDTKSKKKEAAKRPKNQKEITLELASLKSQGYPAPVNLDTGTGKTTSAIAAR